MNKKLTIPIALSSLFLALFVACTPNSGTEQTTSPTFSLTQESTSTASVTISWPSESDNTMDYTISVYRDVDLKELIHEYKLVDVTGAKHKFTVPFLDCLNTFYITVKDSADQVSHPLTVSLEANSVRRNILSQNFDKLCWGYDYINSAGGIRLNNDVEQRLSSYTIESLAESYEDCHIVTNTGEEGGLLFACNNNLRGLMSLEGWSGTKASIYIRPGYVKLGNAYTTSCKLASPTFDLLKEDEKASVDLSFDACVYTTNEGNVTTGEATVAIVKSNGTNLWSKTINLETNAASPAWQHFTFAIDNLTSDCHFEISISGQTKQICFDNLQIIRQLNIPARHIYGYISDKSTGEPIANVAVSDGFQVVVTDEEGFYSMEPSDDSWYIFYSTPSEYKITVGGNGLPKFHTRRTADVREYNFSLRKIEGGAEKKFALFTFADPQVSSKTKLSRFKKEAVPSINEYVKSMDCPCYGITLGDIISNSSGSNSEAFRDEMRNAMQYKYMGLPVFQVMGNHDANYYDEEVPIKPDDKSSTYNLRAQRLFENTYGPINYSFNRGNVHVVGMRDIVYNSTTSMANYTGGFLDSQYEWLKQDLAVVPKSMTVVLCVHIPLHNYRIISAVNHIGKVHQLLNEFQEAHIISGHTHYNRNAEPNTTFKNIYEHNVGTVCGTWWTSNVCGDGTPNGYGVFIGEGTGFSEWYYMGYNEGMNSRDYQLRLYRGNAITGAKIVDNKNGTEGYYQFNFGEDVILANVFNADSKWKIEVYEDGELSGTMKKISTTSANYKNDLVGNYTFDNPRRIKSGKEAANDMWVVGFHMGVLDRFTKSKQKDEDAEGDEEVVSGGSPSNGSWTANTHMYKYTLKNKNAKVKVVAIDRFGNRYESEKFVDYRDNDLAKKP